MFNDLSFRYKIPVRGTVLILITSFAVTAALIFRAYDDLKQDLLANAEGVGQIMAHTLVPVLLKDDVWHAFKLIRAPLDSKLNKRQSFMADSIIVLNNNYDIYAASDPFRFPMLTPLKNVSPTLEHLQQFLSSHLSENTEVLDLAGTDSLYVTSPIISDNVRLGILVMSYPRASFTPRFVRFVRRALFATIIALSILVPLSWYWGVRMANPLVKLASCMGNLVGQKDLSQLHCELYESKDEIGQLGIRFRQMLDELQVKQDLEKQVIATERLVAVGRLTASIGHEINNPLGGMLNTINTYRRYGQLDTMGEKTVSLLERGLLQIRDTVSALLVEAKPTSRHFCLDDANDILTLIKPDIQRQDVSLEWSVEIDTLPISATFVRQILMNLLLNAIKAAPTGGQIGCHITTNQEALMLSVYNNGEPIPKEHMTHLFEPFVCYRSDGTGLGLWVCYQIASQLGGSINAISNEKETRFNVTIPLST